MIKIDTLEKEIEQLDNTPEEKDFLRMFNNWLKTVGVTAPDLRIIIKPSDVPFYGIDIKAEFTDKQKIEREFIQRISIDALNKIEVQLAFNRLTHFIIKKLES